MSRTVDGPVSSSSDDDELDHAELVQNLLEEIAFSLEVLGRYATHPESPF